MIGRRTLSLISGVRGAGVIFSTEARTGVFRGLENLAISSSVRAGELLNIQRLVILAAHRGRRAVHC